MRSNNFIRFFLYTWRNQTYLITYLLTKSSLQNLLLQPIYFSFKKFQEISKHFELPSNLSTPKSLNQILRIFFQFANPATHLSKTYTYFIKNTSLLKAGPAWNFKLKVDNRNIKARCEICFKLTIKTPEPCQRRSGVFTVNFEHISHLVLVGLLLALSIYASWGYIPFSGSSSTKHTFSGNKMCFCCLL